jgi:hypothetical protein
MTLYLVPLRMHQPCSVAHDGIMHAERHCSFLPAVKVTTWH